MKSESLSNLRLATGLLCLIAIGVSALALIPLFAPTMAGNFRIYTLIIAALGLGVLVCAAWLWGIGKDLQASPEPTAKPAPATVVASPPPKSFLPAPETGTEALLLLSLLQ